MTIKEIIEQDFKDSEFLHIEELSNKIRETEWGVGKDLLLKSILLLSGGSIEKLESFFPITDPRDLIMEAQNEFEDLF